MLSPGDRWMWSGGWPSGSVAHAPMLRLPSSMVMRNGYRFHHHPFHPCGWSIPAGNWVLLAASSCVWSVPEFFQFCITVTNDRCTGSDLADPIPIWWNQALVFPWSLCIDLYAKQPVLLGTLMFVFSNTMAGFTTLRYRCFCSRLFYGRLFLLFLGMVWLPATTAAGFLRLFE